MVDTASGIQFGISTFMRKIIISPDDFFEYAPSLPFRTVGSIIDAGSSGRTYNTVLFAKLHNRESFKLKGHYTEAGRKIVIGTDIRNFGQSVILNAMRDDNFTAFRIIYSPLTISYFRARVLSFVTEGISSNNIVKSHIELSNELNVLRVEDAPNTLLFSTIYTDNVDTSKYKVGSVVTVEFTMSRLGGINATVFFFDQYRPAHRAEEELSFISKFLVGVNIHGDPEIAISIFGGGDNNLHVFQHTTDGSKITEEI